ncbi:MAG TPA: vanadium-dependent haloperoxidase [Solirubrobacteraceae bacterium]|nr:vanadium-dependent haloperoxidase [Solirubrobacteraceae bacterium]
MKTLAAAVTGAALLTTAAPAGADTVTEWNQNASTALFVVAAQPPQASTPHLAMVHGAIYDAVNAIDDGREGYLITPGTAQPSASKEAAAATAAHDVLVSIVPAQKATLDAQLATSLAGVPDGPAETEGIAVGKEAAAAMIAARTGDGRFGTFRFAVGSGPGVWRPVLPAFVNDPAAWLAHVKPFLIEDPADFRSAGPLELTSNRYATEFNEVKAIGASNSSVRTDDQTHAARYWAENPPQTWSRILRTLSAQQGLSLVDNARLYATLYLTAADALIAVWNDKAERLFWRPITAIREAATDGNPRTEPQADWTPLIPTPPYPEHPSGHTGLSGSIVKTLQQFFGTDDIGWTDTNVAGLTRSFTTFSQAIEEIEGARVWSGIHFPTADKQGEQIGRKVATYRQGRYFRPGKGLR